MPNKLKRLNTSKPKHLKAALKQANKRFNKPKIIPLTNAALAEKCNLEFKGKSSASDIGKKNILSKNSIPLTTVPNLVKANNQKRCGNSSKNSVTTIKPLVNAVASAENFKGKPSAATLSDTSKKNIPTKNLATVSNLVKVKKENDSFSNNDQKRCGTSKSLVAPFGDISNKNSLQKNSVSLPTMTKLANIKLENQPSSSTGQHLYSNKSKSLVTTKLIETDVAIRSEIRGRFLRKKHNKVKRLRNRKRGRRSKSKSNQESDQISVKAQKNTGKHYWKKNEKPKISALMDLACKKSSNTLNAKLKKNKNRNFTLSVKPQSFKFKRATITSLKRRNKPRYYKISKNLVPQNLFEPTATVNSELGDRLMRKMGWKGHGFGLGKMEQGITAPVELEKNRCRDGLGYLYADKSYARDLKKMDMPDLQMSNDENEKLDDLSTNRVSINDINKLLNNFNESEAADLVFEKTLSFEGKRLMQKCANKLGLKVRYENFGNNKFLVVKKKDNKSE